MRITDLASLLTSALADCMESDRPTMISLVHDTPLLLRYHGPTGETPVPPSVDLTAAELLAGESAWQPVARVSRLLERRPEGFDGCGAKEVLPWLAAGACDWTARLASQMGAKLKTPINSDAIDSRFSAGYEACVGNVHRLHRLSCTLRDAMMEWLVAHRRDAGATGPSSATGRSGCTPQRAVVLRLEPVGEARPPARRRSHTMARRRRQTMTRHRCRYASWLAEDGKVLLRETLEELEARMISSPEIASLLESAKELQAKQEQHQALGDEILQGMNKELSEIVGEARAEGRCVGYRVFSTEVRRLPAEVCLFVDPGVGGHAGVHLVARRAHHEFVLENAQRKLFYFPPVQLVAIIEFTASCPPWHIAVPRIRMPSHHPPWVHPYSGTLDSDRFARAKLLTAEREAMVAPSQQAEQLFPTLKGRLVAEPGMSDLCLDGLRARLKELARCVELQGGEPDVLGLVRGLWTLVRQGLTRAHQRNLETPRVSMENGRMYYTVANRSSLAGTSLAKRIFHYDPA